MTQSSITAYFSNKISIFRHFDYDAIPYSHKILKLILLEVKGFVIMLFAQIYFAQVILNGKIKNDFEGQVRSKNIF